MICEIDILNDEMVLFDETGSSYETAALTTYGEAKRTIQRWVERYSLNVADAYQMIVRYFAEK